MSEAASPAPSSTPPPVGGHGGPQRYGRYVLIDRLGAGGMAEVYRALVLGPENFQRMVVVKRILPHLSANANFVKMFIDEATLCGRLSHPNVIQVHEFGKQDDTYFIAMEYLQGRPLGAVMSRLSQLGEHIPPTIAAEISRQCCLGLAYAHGLTAVDGKLLGIIHRDVSPGNLMVSWTGAVKVLDFGIARVANEFRAGVTDPGQVKGKSAYLSPEQITSGSKVDARADVFAAGILLHEMLVGRRLFKAPNAVETMRLIKEMPMPKPSTINLAVPARLDAIALRALSRKPDDRYQHAGEMAEALESYLIEQRYSSQELGRFMRRIFKDESANDHAQLTNAELEVIKTGVAHEPPVTGDVGPAARQAAGAAKPPPTPRPGVGQKGQATLKAPSAKPVETKSAPGTADEDGVEVVEVEAGFYDRGDDASARASAEHVAGGLIADWPVLEDDDAAAAGGAARKRKLLIGGGVVGGALVLVLALVALFSGSDKPAAPTTVATPTVAPPKAQPPAAADPPPTAAPAPPPAAAAPVVAPRPATAGVAAAVKITITSEPNDAEVFHGEEAVGLTPLVLELPRGSEAVDLRLNKAGYAQGQLKVVPDHDKPVLVTLTRSGGARRKSRGEKVRNAIPIDPFAN